ncbi:DUF2281 domain-containing protein [Coleofasciculus sp. E2-BRE-01]|uniref:DUF2281 domain-containing protein n=1 Tax=Coleofasciculus sp. E2-BRE-01 TaxID=3069524 RepID=UPI0032F919CC
MSAREQLIQEIAQAPDFLVEEVLDFLLFTKSRKSPTKFHDKQKQIRPFALCAGEFTVPPEFNDPLPDQILRDFEG